MPPFPLLDGLSDCELQAIRLDGENYRLAGAYLPLHIAEDAAVRAAVAGASGSRRLIAAAGTAAWIWGATPSAPPRLEYLVDLAARWRPPAGAPVDIIESVVRPGDVAVFGDVSVTTPIRTVLDLARFRADFGETEIELVRHLAEVGRFGAAEAIAAMDRGRNLASKKLAADRIRRALGISRS